MQQIRDYQLDHVNRIREACRQGHRIIVCQGATGSGKTTTMAHITSLAVERGKRTLCLVHRRRLVDQISDRLRDHGVDHGVLMRGEHWSRSHAVQVASRDTLLSRCIRNEWVDMPPADLINLDEAHDAADRDSTCRKILEAYPRATILLWTATPVARRGSVWGPLRPRWYAASAFRVGTPRPPLPDEDFPAKRQAQTGIGESPETW